MRFPSIMTLAQRVREVLFRFPWTMAAGVLAAVATIAATTDSGNEQWGRIAMVVALGLPLTIALTLLGEERRWSPARRAALNAAGVLLLVLFYLTWPGPDRKHEVIRYLQLSAGLHLLVAFLPFLGQRETGAFWQYNRRLFLAILRSALFSLVLFVGLMIALGALDKLFGVGVPDDLYARLGIVVLFVINTGIFLADVPRGIRELASDTSYPKVLKVFAQYILTPLVFIYLIMLLAYLVKIVVGSEWPSGWIGWLIASVAASGLLGFLLVHPLRDDTDEPWIRTYGRWLFIGLIPSAAMLLVAFWKRILPYGLTEPRLLGVLLGIWLLAIAVYYTARQDGGIRRIPVSLASLLLLTLYGPLSLTALSVGSQSSRLGRALSPPAGVVRDAREASASLRFLLDHGDRAAIARAVPGELPPLDWDSLPGPWDRSEAAAVRLLATQGMTYEGEDRHRSRNGDRVVLDANSATAVPAAGYEWLLDASSTDESPAVAGEDTVIVKFDKASSVAHVLVGTDSLVFDVGRLATDLAGKSVITRSNIPATDLRLEAVTAKRRGALLLRSLNAVRTGDSLRVEYWNGRLLLGQPK